MMYPEALLHPEVKLLDEGFCLLILTLRSVSLNPTVSASHYAIGCTFTRRCNFTDAWGSTYSISLRQSKFNRKQFHFRLNHSLVLRFCVPNALGLSYFPSELLAAAGG